MPSRSCRMPRRAYLDNSRGDASNFIPRYTRCLSSTHRCRMFSNCVAHIARHPRALDFSLVGQFLPFIQPQIPLYFSHITGHREYCVSGFKQNTRNSMGIFISFHLSPSLNGCPSERGPNNRQQSVPFRASKFLFDVGMSSFGAGPAGKDRVWLREPFSPFCLTHM